MNYFPVYFCNAIKSFKYEYYFKRNFEKLYRENLSQTYVFEIINN